MSPEIIIAIILCVFLYLFIYTNQQREKERQKAERAKRQKAERARKKKAEQAKRQKAEKARRQEAEQAKYLQQLQEQKKLLHHSLESIIKDAKRLSHIYEISNSNLEQIASFLNSLVEHTKQVGTDEVIKIDYLTPLLNKYTDNSHISSSEAVGRINYLKKLHQFRPELIKRFVEPWVELGQEAIRGIEKIHQIQEQQAEQIVRIKALIQKMQCEIDKLNNHHNYEVPIPNHKDYQYFRVELGIEFGIESYEAQIRRNNNYFESLKVRLQNQKEWLISRFPERQQEQEAFIKSPTLSAAGFIGARNLEWYELPLRILALGSTGSGKSMFLEMALYPIYYAIAKRNQQPDSKEQISDLRALIFDVDGTTLPILDGVGIKSNARYLLNPYDERGAEYGFVGWATGEDLCSRDAIVRFTEIIVPQEDEKSEHFNELVRQLLQVVMIHLRDIKGKDWDLYEALFILVSRQKYLEDILKNNPPFHYEGLYKSVFGRQAHGQDTMSTISIKLRGFLDIAALWNQRCQKISVRRWLKTSSVLVLGWQGGTSKWMSRMNQALIQLFTDIMINEEPETPYHTTTVVIDEATLLAPLPGVDDLCMYCRKKGVSVYIAFQSIPLAEQVFGTGKIKAILGQCDVKALFRQNCADTAQWMAQRCGEAMKDDYLVDISFGISEQASITRNLGSSYIWESSNNDSYPITHSNNFGYLKKSMSKNTSYMGAIDYNSSEAIENGLEMQSGESWKLSIRQQREYRLRIEYTVFLDLPQTTPQTGMTGIVIAPNLHTRRDDISRIHLLPFLINQIRPPRSNVMGFVTRDPRETELIQKLAHTELSNKYK